MTAQEYRQHLADIQARNKQEVLLPVLRTGYSPVNVIYMKAALKRLPKDGTPPDRDATEGEAASADPVLRELWSHKGQLFRERAKLSNRFHECTTDQQRKTNSDAILRIWERIQDANRKMDYYEEHGVLPAGAERFPLPEDPAALLKKLMSLRSQISMEQKRLKDLAALPDDHPAKRTKIEESQAKLAELKLYKGHAEQKAGADIHD